MRYSPTERIGVNVTESIVISDLGWIFREQPIVDLGVDAIIEEVRNKVPTGKFIAIQIKTGASSFNISDKSFTYYVSNIHYHYWLNLNIPIILVAHLPELKTTCWEIISAETLNATPTKWKIDIPRKQLFCKKSENKLRSLFVDGKTGFFSLYQGNIEKDSLFDVIEKLDCVNQSIPAIYRMVDEINEISNAARDFTAKADRFIEQNLTDKDAPVLAQISTLAKNLNLSSKRLKLELEIYAELFAIGTSAFNQALYVKHFFDSLDGHEISATFTDLMQSFDKAQKATVKTRDIYSKLPSKYPGLKESKKHLLSVLDSIIYELSHSINLASSSLSNYNFLVQQNKRRED